MIKPSYLLAGSISLLGVIASLPAQAATEVSSVQTKSVTQLQPVANQQSDALLALQVPTQTPEAVAAPLNLEVAPLNLAQAAPAPIPDSASVRNTAKTVDRMISGDETMDQVTSITQLSDVKPTDWAFQALQSLVERYGCIAGYPNGTFRGQRAATRFELAAALNACLDVISDRFATKEDLNTLRRLQQEFAKELAALKGRVTSLEARTAKLEATQFSTTTKLQAVATMSFQAGSFGRNFSGSGPNAYSTFNGDGPGVNPTVIGAVILNLNTSFSGSDLLQTSLAFGNAGQDTIGVAALGTTGFLSSLSPSGTTPGPYFSPGQYYWAGFPTSPILYRLAYTFKPFKDVTITAGPQFYPSDIIDFNSFANAPASDFGSYFFINNPFIVPYAINFAGGAGAAVQWNPGGGPFTVKGLYVAAGANLATRNNAGTNIDGGFFGDPYQASLELQYASAFGKGSKNNFAVRLQYTNARTYSLGSNAVGINAEASFGRFGVFGRFGYAFLNNVGTVPAGFNDPLPYGGFIPSVGNYNAMTFSAGVAYKDLLVPGSLIGLGAGAPFITQNRGESRTGQVNDRNQVNIEAFYRFPINDNISITPIFSAIINPNNSSFNDTIYQGVLRTTFTF